MKDPEKRKLYDTYGKKWQAGQEQQQTRRNDQKFTQRPRQGRTSTDFRFDSNGAFEETSGYSDFFNTFFGDGFSDRHEQSFDFKMPGRSHEAEITVSLQDVFHGATKAISFMTYEAESNGQVRPVTKTLQVKIPKGMTNGSIIRLAGQGERGSGPVDVGDLLLRINIAPDARFRIEGHDLYTVVAVSPWRRPSELKSLCRQSMAL